MHPTASVGEMSEAGGNPGFRALFQELRRLGHVEGRNLVVERYSAEGGGQKRYAELIPKLVATNPALILAVSNSVVLSLKTATDSIPIVAFMTDPVTYRIVTSLARPGGNITGVTGDSGLEIWAKRLQILLAAFPTASKVGFLTRVWRSPQTNALQEAAREAGIALLGPSLEDPVNDTEYRRVLGMMVEEHADGLIVGDTAANFTNRQVIVDLVQRARLPTIYPYHEHVDIGGLIAYASPPADLWRRMAGQIDEILKGSKPSEMPIFRASKFELLVNLKTAKSLGLTIPPTLLARADEVIE